VDLLKTAGYQVAQAGNGREALALIANEPPDLLLTDIVMPEKDGLELIQDVRKLQLKTTIVAMSGAARAHGYLSIARLLGAKCTLRKPVAFDHLLNTLRAASSPDI
jgi:YesN/AraC family two-component response regulator